MVVEIHPLRTFTQGSRFHLRIRNRRLAHRIQSVGLVRHERVAGKDRPVVENIRPEISDPSTLVSADFNFCKVQARVNLINVHGAIL